MGLLSSITGFSYRITHNIWFYIASAAIILALVIINSIIKKKKTKLELVSSNEEIEDFIRDALEREHLESNIKKVLVKDGWPEKQVELTMEKVKKEGKPKLFNLIPVPWKIKTEEERIAEKVNKMLGEQKKDEKETGEIIEEAFDMKEREDEFEKLADERLKTMPKQKTAETEMAKGIMAKDVIKVLLATDQLLEKLPEEEINSFMQSRDAELFAKVMDDAKKQKAEKIVTKKTTLKDLMALSEKGIITKQEARELIGMQDKETAGLEQKEKEIGEEEKKLEQKEKQLKEKEAKLKQAPASGPAPAAVHESVTDEMKETLKIVDNLLGKLPHNEIEAFAKSPAYEKYAKIMKTMLGKEAAKPEEKSAEKARPEETKKEEEKKIDAAEIKAAIKAKLKQG